ncbi:hypothetical protein H7169_02180 [Candidatus Gracilibacteria bacterium]|nr:hypothetical protein [Candidatus Gracilibacteria bacterium]
MPNENPGAYNEARDRIREKKEKEVVIIESKKEEFEKTKEKMRKKKGLDVHGLRQKIETGHSLDSLKSDIRMALSEGTISRDTYDSVIASIDGGRKEGLYNTGTIDPEKLPFSQNKFAKYLENQPLGENIGSDMVGFLYGLIVQGSAILIIIAWRIFIDFLFLPRDIYREIKIRNSKS